MASVQEPRGHIMCGLRSGRMLTVLLTTAGLAVGGANGQAEPLCPCELAKLTASDPDPNDAFGGAVCISADTAVVGAANADGTGAAYVFQYDGTAWSEVAKLSASDLPGDAKFAGWCGIDGDTIVIGAMQDDDGGGYSGSAFVFIKPQSGDWISTDQPCAKLTASNPAPNDLFGIGVAISGDTIVIGSTNDDDAGANSGSAYLFKRPPGGWQHMTETVKLTACDAAALDGFGRSLAIEGNTVVVGALSQSGGPSAAYVFERGSGWLDGCTNQVAKLTATDGAPGHKFGRYVAINGGTVAVGAEQLHVGPGAVYVFEKVAGSWVQQAKLTTSDGALNDLLGRGLSVHGDIIAAGAPLDDDAGANSGSAYLFKRPTEGWQSVPSPIHEVAKLTASDASAGDQFGLGVALSDDTLFVGAHVVMDTRGSAYVFSLTCNEPPIITCNGPVVLWSPHHELVDVSSAFTVEDPDNDPVTLSFRVISDESETPETGDGTGRHAPDFKDESFPGGRGLLVRSERRGREDGRYYVFVVTADDGNGGVTTGVCIAAVVPHDQEQQSLDDVIGQAQAAALVVRDAIDIGGELPPPGLYEHGLADPLGPKQ